MRDYLEFGVGALPFRLTFTERVKRAFDVAEDYDMHAAVQPRVAQALGERIARLPLPENPRILEIGCGTGALSAALLHHWRGADMLMTDIAPSMVERSRQRLHDAPNLRFGVLDGEAPVLPKGEPPFDLICSSLAAQWFTDLPRALERLLAYLKPGGFLMITTLTKGTFSEWIGAHVSCGCSSGVPAYPSLDALRMMAPADGVCEVEEVSFVDRPSDGLSFLRSLRAIGAGTPAVWHKPVSAADMRRVIRNFDETSRHVSYNVAFCQIVRDRIG